MNVGNGVVPTDAAFLRIRAGVTVGTATASATIKLTEIKLGNGSTELSFVDEFYPASYGTRITSSNGLIINGNSYGTAGSNPRILLVASLGEIAFDASNYSATGGTPIGGNIFLAHAPNGKVYFGGSAGAYFGDTNIYRQSAGVLATNSSIAVTGNIGFSGAIFGATDFTGPALQLAGNNARLWSFSSSSGAADVIASNSV